MPLQTRSQKMARTAFSRVEERGKSEEYRAFARSFPTLIHQCGLAQAVAFAQAKNAGYVADLEAVLETGNLDKRTR
ncbi:MAG: type III-B CRISPR module-associated protein Cmr5, partial [Gemmataceae bacterium]|nr:type III-B CRISPR module-associated protein Cmr5 [Gemmataceae bacterium]